MFNFKFVCIPVSLRFLTPILAIYESVFEDELVVVDEPSAFRVCFKS